MLIRPLLSAISIVIFWTLFDALLHRYFLVSFYRENPALWRPFEQMNVALASMVTLVLVAFFVVTYLLLVSPKSLHAGMTFGALVGMALGVASGFGTYVHSPIPIGLAWGWLGGGWLKAFGAGIIVGLLIH